MTKIDQSKLIKLEEIKKGDINPYPYTFPQMHHAQVLLNKYSALNAEEKTHDQVSVAGRIMLKRGMGKATFMHIQDQSGKIQIYVREDDLGQEMYEIITKKTDLGDILGISGTIFKTKMGEITVYVKSAQLLSKSLLPMPEKYHGLKDIELKYRQRYIDLTVNPEVKEVFQKRSRIVQEIRHYFQQKGFMEVEIPVLQTIYGGASAKPFITHINTWNMQMYLSISPETYLKRLLVGGFEKVFSIGKNFRNEDVDTSHNPEFTMLEIYQAYVDYTMMMEYLEQMYEKACMVINGTTQVEHIYKGEKVILNFQAPWKRLSMIDAIKQYVKVDVSTMTENHLRNFLEDNRIEWEGTLTWGLGVLRIFEEMVEEHLIQPVHITDHPKESTPLCKLHRNDSRLIERFESFCLGMELSNAYSELNDPLLQRKLLEEQAHQLRAGSAEAHPMDEDFLNAIEFGMPPAGGLGVGIDRMVMILTGQNSIRDVILFPTMKQIEENKPEQKSS